jgi:amidase
VLGKTNLTELANFMSDHMPNGYSARGGQVKNPYGAYLDPGGSSAGSGVAVAAGLVPFAVGTETSGSILSPASQNSVVGLKPSLGLISRFGIIPIAHSQDTAGPMTTTVRDAALLLTVMAGPDARDPITFTSPFAEGHNFTQYLVLGSLAGIRLGMASGGYRDNWGKSERQVMMQAVQAFRDLNAEVVEEVLLPFPEQFSYDVLLFEFKVGIDAYLNQLGQESPVHSLADIIQFNHRHADRALKYGQSILLAAEATRGTLTEPRYWQSRAQDIKWARTEGFDQAFDHGQLDAILFCGSGGADIAARAGYPSLTVPAGYGDRDQPVGVTLTGRRFSEPLLLRLGYAFEQYTKSRRPPNADGRH